MAEKYNRDRKQDKPVVDPGEGLPHQMEVHLAAGQVEEGQTDQTTDNQPTPVASQVHGSVILISSIPLTLRVSWRIVTPVPVLRSSSATEGGKTGVQGIPSIPVSSPGIGRGRIRRLHCRVRCEDRSPHPPGKALQCPLPGVWRRREPRTRAAWEASQGQGECDGSLLMQRPPTHGCWQNDSRVPRQGS